MKKTDSKMIKFQLALNKTYSHTPPSLIHQRFKHSQRTKINKTMLSASSGFHAKFTISVSKSTQVFHPNGNWTQTTSVGVLNWASIVYATFDSEHKFQKMGIENWLPTGFNLTLIATPLCLNTIEKSLKVLYTYP